MTVFSHRSAVALVLAIAIGVTTLRAQDTAHVVVVATTNAHGRVFHWDYVRDTVVNWALTRAATVLDSLWAAYPDGVVVLDAGDLIRGSSLATYFARENPVAPHPEEAAEAVRAAFAPREERPE